MDAYTGFASVYDLFMDDVPYDEWCEYVNTLLGDYKITDGIVLDLGCGTGKFTELMAHKGFDMIGVDAAEEMLAIARERQADSGLDILYLLQDMCAFELYGTVAAVVSICDSINYITGEEDLLQVFKLVNNYLDPGGLFVFDLNTEYKYREVLADNVFAEKRDEGSFIWENFYDEQDRINEYDLTLFIKEGIHPCAEQIETEQIETEQIETEQTETEHSLRDLKQDNSEQDCSDWYHKYEETHYQRAYSLDEIKNLLQEAHLEFVAAYDAFTRNPVREDSERIYIIAREHTK